VLGTAALPTTRFLAGTSLFLLHHPLDSTCSYQGTSADREVVTGCFDCDLLQQVFLTWAQFAQDELHHSPRSLDPDPPQGKTEYNLNHPE
jgi:hypothetical protein